MERIDLTGRTFQNLTVNGGITMNTNDFETLENLSYQLISEAIDFSAQELAEGKKALALAHEYFENERSDSESDPVIKEALEAEFSGIDRGEFYISDYSNFNKSGKAAHVGLVLHAIENIRFLLDDLKAETGI